jgi:eukaryotic-like serine/threonine-protein kinase
MKSALRFAVLALVLVIVAMVSALTAMRFAIHGQEVAVPPLIGLAPAEAERAVAAAGLEMTIERQYYSPQIPEGRIMSQLPLPGIKVRRGWEVRVAQSLGPTRVAIPDVTGQSEHAAELNILRRGLEIASMAEVGVQGIPADQVLAQSPPPNATQVLAPNISLLLTATPLPQAFVMPSFVGQPLGTVSRTLEDAGFKLGNVSMAPPLAPPAAAEISNPATGPTATAPATAQSATAAPTTPSTPPGQSSPNQSSPAQPSPASVIASQSPAAGQKVIAGATVNFEVR